MGAERSTCAIMLYMFSDPEYNVSQFELSPGMTVAEFGCGAGYYSILLAKALHGSGRVYAIDVNDDLLAKVKNAAQKDRVHIIETVRADIEKLGGVHLHDHSVDRVVIANTLFQVKNRPIVLAEAKRILKKNGTLYLIDWRDTYGGIGPHHAEIITESHAKELAERAGFAYYKKMSVGEHHYGLAFKIPAVQFAQ